ncbi:MAG: hypothetical protein A2288_02350 [Candidatus Moranbacteria bacterium RIFOXYA12_FULL_44_15]|nr:MAG: hypothetical protein A2288_02350 [Candidatus Moranbacteria bacterium RIFOXYA12_FULL_44_15]OGI34682.1 MAG: hypothetical protein A2259_04925 [Candidatus Moranbacteria bacterium RIFOXYA2_FULL_43_15]
MVKKIIFSAAILVLGASGGYYAGSILNDSGASRCFTFDRAGEETGSTEKEKARLKLDLLKDYTNLVYLPAEKIGDANAYVGAMDQKVKAIANDKISEKYYATGTEEGREAKILDFFNFLIEEAKNDLK